MKQSEVDALALLESQANVPDVAEIVQRIAREDKKAGFITVLQFPDTAIWKDHLRTQFAPVLQKLKVAEYFQSLEIEDVVNWRLPVAIGTESDTRTMSQQEF